MSRQLIDQPSKLEVHEAYLTPQSVKHWERIQRLVLTGGFGVEPNPHLVSEQRREIKGELPEFRITWPDLEKESQDYQLSFEVCRMVIGTLQLEDSVFSNSTLPTIFKTLEKTYLYSQLFQKVSVSQGNTVRHHIETVPTLIQTTKENLQERFVLRMTAIFHDVGKAFNIGRDQVHYHALIGSNIVAWFMEKYKDKIINYLYLFDKHSTISVISRDEQGVLILNRADLELEFQKVTRQITEIIRLHHVLEQIQKGVLNINDVSKIFVDKKVDPFTYGLFAIADGSSVIPDNAKYAEYLVMNLNELLNIVDLIDYQNLLANNMVPMDVKAAIAQTLLFAIREVVKKVGYLPEKVRQIIKEIADKIDTALACALLSF